MMALLLPAVMWAQTSLPRSPHPQYDRMVEAAKRCQAAERVIYAHKRLLGLLQEETDVNRTGMVGADTSIMTTTAGLLSAKRTATNPDFAAYFVRELSERGVEANDTVLIGMTGSLPGLNLAMVIAVELLEIPSLRIASLGSSSHGANQLAMTWLDIEDILFREGLIQERCRYVTLGGFHDIGGLNCDESLKILRDKCVRLGYPLLESANLDEQRELRLEVFGSLDRYALVINIGRNHQMLGDRNTGPDLPGGWVDPESFPWPGYRNSDPTGLVFDLLEVGVPLFNLLHVDQLCEQSGIPYDPQPLPRVGTSGVYFLEASP